MLRLNKTPRPEYYDYEYEKTGLRRAVRAIGWVVATSVGFSALAAASVPIFKPDAMPKFAGSSNEPITTEDKARRILNACRFNDGVLCTRISGLIAVRPDDNQNEPAVKNPVVITVDSMPYIVSNNLATDSDKTSKFVLWPADNNVVLCRGDSEPLIQRLHLGLNPNTFGFKVADTGNYSNSLDAFAAECRYRVSNDILNNA